jgi:hypothetical protein
MDGTDHGKILRSHLMPSTCCILHDNARKHIPVEVQELYCQLYGPPALLQQRVHRLHGGAGPQKNH